MKFMVVVNNKYRINVDANTHGGAEHKILDDFYYGIEQCQAFSMDELTTETFKYFAEHCETISANELMEKCETYKKYLDEKFEEEQKVKEYSERILKLKKELQLLESNRQTCQFNVVTITNNIAKVF